MKEFGIAFIICIFSNTLSAQVSQKYLIGEWRLDSLFEKQISPLEKQKRYIFTSDSLLYRSPRKNIDGTYLLVHQKGILSWKIPDVQHDLILYLNSINKDTLQIKEHGDNAVTGIVIRISEIGKDHFQKALKAEMKKDFNLAFAELKKAAEYHHPDAMYLLGMYYFTGIATMLDEKAASKWIKAAAHLGNAKAQAIVNSNSLKN